MPLSPAIHNAKRSKDKRARKRETAISAADLYSAGRRPNHGATQSLTELAATALRVLLCHRQTATLIRRASRARVTAECCRSSSVATRFATSARKHNDKRRLATLISGDHRPRSMALVPLFAARRIKRKTTFVRCYSFIIDAPLAPDAAVARLQTLDSGSLSPARINTTPGRD